MEARQVGPYGQEKVVFARGGETQQIAGVPEIGDAQHLVLREAARGLPDDGVEEELIHRAAGPAPGAGRLRMGP